MSPWLDQLRAKDGSSSVSFESAKSGTKSTKVKVKLNQPVADFDVFIDHPSGDKSLDEDFGILKVKTPRVQTMDGETSLRRSTRVKYPLERLNYDSFAMYHYA